MNHWDRSDWLTWPILLLVTFYVTTERFLDWSPLSKVEWDAVAAFVTTCAIWAALWIAGADRRERRRIRDEATQTFASLVRAEISNVQARAAGLRNFAAGMKSAPAPYQIANWPRLVGLTHMLELPITDKLLERALDVDATSIKGVAETLTMIAQLRTLVESWGDREEDVARNAAHVYSAYHILSISLQLTVNEAVEQIWSASKSRVAPPPLPDATVHAAERALLEDYMSQNGIDVSRLFPIVDRK